MRLLLLLLLKVLNDIYAVHLTAELRLSSILHICF